MSSVVKRKVNYGFSQPLNFDNPLPVLANRAPTGSDHYPLGQEWIYVANNAVYFLTSITNNTANWQLMESSGGAGVFTSLTVNPGPTNLSTVGNGNVTIGNATNTGDIDIVSGATGDINITTLAGGDLNITGGAGLIEITVGSGDLTIIGAGNAINIGDDAAANQITIGSTTGAALLALRAGTSGISMVSGGIVAVSAAIASVASPTALAVINSRVCKATFTGFTTASTSTQPFTLQSTFITTASAIVVNVANLNASGNNAALGIQSVVQSAGQIVVTAINNGAGALGAGDNVILTAWILT